jgi:hypothetical protein
MGGPDAVKGGEIAPRVQTAGWLLLRAADPTFEYLV